MVDYYFEELQPLRFMVFNINNRNSLSVGDQELVGYVDLELADLINSTERSLLLELKCVMCALGWVEIDWD